MNFVTLCCSVVCGEMVTRVVKLDVLSRFYITLYFLCVALCFVTGEKVLICTQRIVLLSCCAVFFLVCCVVLQCW